VRVALVAPVEEAVPPSGYGGIEGVVHDLAVGLAARGHDVLLLASGDSTCPVERIALCQRAVRDTADAERTKEEAAEKATRVLVDLRPDIVHNHMWRLDRSTSPIPAPLVTTVHYPLPDARRYSGDGHYVSISHSQQRSSPRVSFIGNVYNGIQLQSFEPRLDGTFEGLLFLGRLSPDKGADLAVRVARSVGLPLTLAAKRMAAHADYFDNCIAPYVDGQQIRYVGEVGQAAKRELLRRAAALLYPVRWDEPFGLAMVEAMACGTPVIGFDRGGVAELVAHGRTGFVVDSVDDMVHAAREIASLSRHACRQHAEAHFSATRMVSEYERIYCALPTLV